MIHYLKNSRKYKMAASTMKVSPVTKKPVVNDQTVRTIKMVRRGGCRSGMKRNIRMNKGRSSRMKRRNNWSAIEKDSRSFGNGKVVRNMNEVISQAKTIGTMYRHGTQILYQRIGKNGNGTNLYVCSSRSFNNDLPVDDNGNNQKRFIDDMKRNVALIELFKAKNDELRDKFNAKKYELIDIFKARIDDFENEKNKKCEQFKLFMKCKKEKFEKKYVRLHKELDKFINKKMDEVNKKGKKDLQMYKKKKREEIDMMKKIILNDYKKKMKIREAQHELPFNSRPRIINLNEMNTSFNKNKQSIKMIKSGKKSKSVDKKYKYLNNIWDKMMENDAKKKKCDIIELD